MTSLEEEKLEWCFTVVLDLPMDPFKRFLLSIMASIETISFMSSAVLKSPFTRIREILCCIIMLLIQLSSVISDFPFCIGIHMCKGMALTTQHSFSTARSFVLLMRKYYRLVESFAPWAYPASTLDTACSYQFTS